MNEKIKILREQFKNNDAFDNIRLLFITEKEFVWFYYGSSSEECVSEDFCFIKNLREVNRGKILDLFARLEIVINELIQLHLLGQNAEQAKELDKLLECTNLWTRARLLEKWKVIDHELFDKIIKVNEVRNKLAHVWDEKTEVMYYKDYDKTTLQQSEFRMLFHDIADEFRENEKITVRASIRTLFEEFKRDFEEVWKRLIEVYKQKQETFDLDALIQQALIQQVQKR